MKSSLSAVTELFWLLTDIDAFVYYVTACLVLAVCWFIREIVGTTTLALISAPVLMATGVGAHFAFNHAMIRLVIDKDTNVALMSAIGVLVGLVLVVVSKWLLTLWKEHSVRNTRLDSAARAAR